MTARFDTDRQLAAWLEHAAPAREPEHLLGQVLARTARTGRRPAWRIPERWFPMSVITTRVEVAPQVPWRLLAIALTLAAALVAGLLVAGGAFRPVAPPYGLAANGALFYSSQGDLYARTEDGAIRAILAGTTTDSAPLLSPDGTRALFLREITGGSELWSIAVDGSDARQLDAPFRDIGWFEWSPQGDLAVVLSNADPNAMTLVPTYGGAGTRIDLGVLIDQPVFRPASGSQIAFLGRDAEHHPGIYLVNRDGSGLTLLRLDPGHETDPLYESDKDGCCYFAGMSWSPTGDRLLYTQSEPTADGQGLEVRTHLAMVDAEGAVLSDQLLDLDGSSEHEFDATWLPSGDAFVFQTGSDETRGLAIVSIGPTGVGPARDLGMASTGSIGFQVSPDGRQLLAFTMEAGNGGIGIYLIDLASLRRTPVDLGIDATWQRLAP